VPLPRIDVDTFCTQTMSQQPQLVVYSGNIAATVWQWGFEAVDVTLPNKEHHRNGVGKTGGSFCSSPLLIVGDCWQSVNRIAVSPDAPKWLVAAGAPNMCKFTGGPLDGQNANGIAVWKWKAATSTFEWQGFILDHTDRGSPVYLDGDFAWASQGVFQHPQLWSKFDLNAMTATRDFAAPVQGPVQTNIQGYTYTIHPIFPVPLPNPWPGPHKFYWQREGGPVETPTPVVTATPAASPTAPPTPIMVCPTNTPKPCPCQCPTPSWTTRTP
jgi:hypothetical protein